MITWLKTSQKSSRFKTHLPHFALTSVLKNLRTERRASEWRVSEQPRSRETKILHACSRLARGIRYFGQIRSLARRSLALHFPSILYKIRTIIGAKKWKIRVFFGSDSSRSKQYQSNADFPTRFHLKIMKETITNDAFTMTKPKRPRFVNN